MNRFIKNQWDDVDIPEQAYIQARNRAWSRLQTRRATLRPVMLWAAAASLLAVVTLLLRWPMEPIGVETGARVQQASKPKTDSQMDTVAQVPQPPESIPRATSVQASRRGPTLKSGALKTAAARPPDRVVLNFVLPETGVRMIWISDKNFRLDGANE